MGAAELRDRAVARTWALAGLCLTRTAPVSTELLARTAAWAGGVLNELGAVPPLGIVADLGGLALAGELPPTQSVMLDDAALRSAVRLYEHELLGRLAGDRRLERVADALSKLPAALVPEGVGLFTAAVLRRCGFQVGVALNPGVLRSLGDAGLSEVTTEGFAALRQHDAPLAALVEGYTELVRGARHVPELIAESDVFILENLTVLRSLTQRLAVEQVASAAAALDRVLPKKMRRSRHEGRIPTTVEDDAQYPVGGFSSVGNSGSLENLVTSELIYMDDPTQASSVDDVDLFEVRYVEGELLYYTRDESVFVREHRCIQFVFHPSLIAARYKDREVEWQRLIVLLGLVLCLMRRLSEWLSETGLLFRVVFVQDAHRAHPLANERALAELLLREWIQKGTAEVVDARDWDTVVQSASAASQGAVTDVVSFACGAPPSAEVDRVAFTGVDVSDVLPRVQRDGGKQAALPASSAWQAWLDVTAALARTLC